jgi:N-acetylmuramic acid 6-phosphate etherase
MTSVNPGNLKLIGRATSLILMHCNDALSRPNWPEWSGRPTAITYSEANAVLFDAMAFTQRFAGTSTAEVGLAIIRILESVRTRSALPWEETMALYEKLGLEKYLREFDPGAHAPATDN